MFNRFLMWTGLLRTERSLADVILNSRRGKSLAIASSVLALISIVINYAMWTFPVFEEPDFGNTAIMDYLSSDFYRNESTASVKRLELYNEGDVSAKPTSLKFFYPFRGVTVKHEMTLVPREGNRPNGENAYKFENTFKVSLNIVHLMFFVLLLGLLLAIGVYALLNRPPKAFAALEESILNRHFAMEDESPPAMQTLPKVEPDDFALVERICTRFHLVAKQLGTRHAQRETLHIKDEYDTQYLLHALLHVHFDDIRAEEWTPSYAGSGSRVDFLLKNESIVIEVKKTRSTLKAKDIGAELIVDSQRYRSHPDCNKLFCFVYDPEGWISNPRGLENDLNKQEQGFEMKVIIVPKGH